MKNLLVFDLDGTLIDSAEDISQAIIHAAHITCQLPPNTITLAQTAPLLGKNLHETFASLLDPDYHPLIEDCVEAYRQYYLANCVNKTTVYPGVFELLATLRKQGFKLAIATTKRQATAETVAAKTGLTPYVDLVQGVENFPSKPDPAILHVVMDKLSATPAQTLMVGDTDNDVLCAQRAEVTVCAVSWGAWTAPQLAALEPDHIVDSLAELSRLLLSSPVARQV